MRYKPSNNVPDELAREFEEISDVLLKPDVEAIFLAPLNAAPAKVKAGLLVYADGTNWNPGSGEGAYLYYNSTWNYLG